MMTNSYDRYIRFYVSIYMLQYDVDLRSYIGKECICSYRDYTPLFPTKNQLMAVDP